MKICADRGWEYQEIEGDLTLFQRWLDGPWPEQDYLIVEPGATVVPSYDEGIIQIEPMHTMSTS
ncbi:MAG: hypothetical protein HOE86_15070 [Gemmatimonadetes bacterium]|jgi:hypothetical protein|nr:hypothetical protein [Gemmatimonadota bacterium]